MLKKLWLSLVMVSALSLVAQAQDGRLHLIEDGRAAATIVIPANPGKWTHEAARWLQEYVQKATGAKLNAVTEDTPAPLGTVISVGHTKMAATAEIDARGLKFDGCKLIVKGNVLYLIGRDSTKTLKDQPFKGARGTCRAVLTLLEDHCGIRWFLPGPNGEFLPKSTDISVPKDLAKTFSPAFAFSDGRFPYDYGYLVDGGATPASIINNYRNTIVGSVGGETYGWMIPDDSYSDHPEYFALIDGKRDTTPRFSGRHMCSSHPMVKEILTKALLARFEEGHDWAGLGQEDGYRRCQCENCEKLDNYRWPGQGRWGDFQNTTLKDTPCERLFLLHKAVIDAAAEAYPDRKVVLLCYAPTAWPSKKIDYLGDNVILLMTNQDPEYIAAWKGKVPHMAGYVYWFDIQIPMGFNVHATPREVSAKIRYLNDAGFLGLYHFMETNWGFQGPCFYVLGKMMGDPSLDYRVLVKEYCQGVFGKAAGSMLNFFDPLYAKLEKEIPQPVTDFDARNTGLPRDMDTVAMYLKLYPPELLDRMEALLDRAAVEADTDRTKGWVKHTREYFDFTNLLTRSLISHRAWQENKTKENWLDLKKRVETFDALRTRIINYSSEYAHEWFPGHGYFCNWMTANLVKEPYTYYVPWEERKPEVLKKGIKGIAIGHGDSYYYSRIVEPLTLDFSKEPAQ